MCLRGCGTETKDQQASLPGEVLHITHFSGEASQTPACCTVGTLYDTLAHAQGCSLTAPPSLEVFFVRLASFAPLFLCLTPTSHPGSAARQDSAEMLLEYCAGMTASLYSTLHPFMRRLLRDVRVSWQPWLSSPKIARVIAAAAAGGSADGDWGYERSVPEHVSPSSVCDSADSSLEALRCLPGDGGRSGTRAGKHRYVCTSQDAVTAENAWQPLLEHVPPFFVATARVQASLRRAYSDAKALRLLDAWSSQSRLHATAPLDVVAHAECRNPSRLRCKDSRCDGPYVEASPCGTAIRAPSPEQCLQAGCPAWLLYKPQHAPATLHEKYMLSHCVDDCGPWLMHMALALVCAVVPSTSQPLSVVRQIFSDHQRQQCSLWQQERYSEKAIEAADGLDIAPAAAHAACASFFPCVEVLLDHPQLAFAVQVTERSTGCVCARFPVPSEAGARTAAPSNRLQELQVQLHPSFSHAQRGRADAALSVLEKTHRITVLAEVPRPQHKRDAPFDISHVCAVRFHDARDGVLTESLEALLQLLEKELATTLAAGSVSDAEQAFFLGVSEVAGLGDEAPIRRDASTTVHGARYAPESPRLVLLLTAVHSDSRVMDVIAVEGRTLCSQLRRMRADDATTSGTDEEQVAATKDRLLPVLARVLQSPTLVKVLPSSAFVEDSLCGAHLLRQRGPSAVRWLLDSLRSEALTSVCSLEHIAHYVGYPVDGVMPLTLTSEADSLLASTILSRYRSAIDTTTTPQGSGSGGETRGSALEQSTSARVICGAATVSLAGSLLLQNHAQEHPLHMPHEERGKHNDGSATESTLGMTLLCALQRWAREPTLARQHGLALRLERFQRWLAHATAGNVDDLIAHSRASSDAAARHLPMGFAAEQRCLGGREVTLRDLVSRFGPEPLPSPCWMRGRQTAHSRKVKRGCCDAGVATVKDTGDQIVKAKRSDSEERPSLPFPAELSASEGHVDVDALVHDALVREAAAVLQAVARHASPTKIADSDAATSTPLHNDAGLPLTPKEASTDAACSRLPSPPCSPRSDACATSGAGAPVEEDSLQSYLSTLFDEADARPTATTSLQRPGPAAQSSALTSSAQRPEGETTGADPVGAPNMVPSLRSTTAVSGATDLSTDHLPAAPASHPAACGFEGSGRDDPPTAKAPVSSTLALPMGFLYGPASVITTSKSFAAPRLASAKSGAGELSHPLNFPVSPGLYGSREAPRQGWPPPPNQSASIMESAKSAPSSRQSPSEVLTTYHPPSLDANFAPVARFDRFAPWRQSAPSAPNPQDSPPSPPPQSPFSSPCAMPSTCQNESAQPPRPASLSSATPTGSSLQTFFSFDSKDAERLRLRSLLVDTLRGTTKRPPPSPRR
ncbi:hypothetical protein LMJF_34_2640 [Leishmania major strain Friedlin]|uniref:Uncharacterized protein n=1 Tax=Leishmania major TaxID=5664 RepID=Q4Q2T1_LEIMA|nr:hypothetical protein LMJF_34_2640 [Leishmania major strain Friedlin]CAG9582141.1 hypothetical_protein_-_conserved [Leishmania major strain Friedlin]CAJ07984.1 hypothetical protein LMJF_34_2640 [Leishmania major strain Friedlin]|eukprot:XP_001686367.1 hypothetical protein LMJF_34_2640 [Leishmania major strain Friedlin]